MTVIMVMIVIVMIVVVVAVVMMIVGIVGVLVFLVMSLMTLVVVVIAMVVVGNSSRPHIGGVSLVFGVRLGHESHLTRYFHLAPVIENKH